jgi:hypothetical protein
MEKTLVWHSLATFHESALSSKLSDTATTMRHMVPVFIYDFRALKLCVKVEISKTVKLLTPHVVN